MVLYLTIVKEIFPKTGHDEWQVLRNAQARRGRQSLSNQEAQSHGSSLPVGRQAIIKERAAELPKEKVVTYTPSFALGFFYLMKPRLME